MYVGIVLTRVLNVPEILASIFALPIFFVLPLLVGMTIGEFLRLYLRNKIQKAIVIDNLSYFILCLFAGIFFIELVAVILQLLELRLLLQNIGYLMLTLITASFPYFVLSGSRRGIGQGIETYFRKYLASIILLIGFGVGPFLLKYLLVPPPLTTWSSWANPIPQVQAVLRLLNQGFFDITQRWMEILFTAISCQIFNIHSPEFFAYAGTFLLTSMFSLGTFALARSLSSKTWFAFLCGAICIFLNVPIGYHEIPAYHFKSNTLLISLAPWAILLILNVLKRQRISTLKNLFALITPISLFFAGIILISSSVLIQTFYSFGLQYETQLALIRPLMFLLIPLSIFMVYIFVRHDISPLVIVLLTTVALYTTNESDFIVYFVAIMLFISLLYFVTRTARKGHILLLTLSLLVFSAIFLGWINVLSFPNIPISSLLGLEQPLQTNNFIAKKIVFSDGNSTMVLYLFALGFALLASSRSKKDLLVLGMLSLVSFIFFFPDYWSMRILGLLTPFMAFAICKNFDMLSKLANSLLNHRPKIKIVTLGILSSLLILSLAPNLVTPLYLKFSSFPPSRMTPYEYEAAVWLRDNTRETQVIISDYWSMMLLNSMSNKIWLTSRQYMASSLSPEYQTLLAELGNNVFKANSSMEAWSNIQAMAGQMRAGIDWTEKYYMDYIGINPENITFLIVLSARTVKWLTSGSMDIMDPQFGAVNYSYLQVFSDSHYFIQLANFSQQLYVFQVVES
jgi:hypothetical protein